MIQKRFTTAILMKRSCCIIASSGTVQAMPLGKDTGGTYFAM